MRIGIIGGGLSGLAAAALAARAGHQVKLFEKASEVGGRAATQDVRGYSLNLGAHALYGGGAGVRVLDELGVRYSGGRPDGHGYAIANGSLRTLPAGFVSILSTSLLSLSAKMEVGKLLARVSKLDPAACMHEPVAEWIDRAVMAPDARQYLRGMFRLTTYSADLDRFSAGVAIGLLQRVVVHGVTYIDGGWSTLVEGLRRAALDAGADIVTGERAVSVETEGAEVARIRLASGHASPADAAIIAASPSTASTLFPSSRSLARFCRENQVATAACLDIALSRLPKPRARFALGIDRPLYFSVHSGLARLAPGGGAVVHAAFYRPTGSTETHDAIEAELEATFDLLQPGWRDQVVERRFLPKLVVSNAIPTADAGGYLGRAAEAVPEVSGLFVAGDWVGRDGCLADAALGSAKAAVEAATALAVGSRRYTSRVAAVA